MRFVVVILSAVAASACQHGDFGADYVRYEVTLRVLSRAHLEIIPFHSAPLVRALVDVEIVAPENLATTAAHLIVASGPMKSFRGPKDGELWCALGSRQKVTVMVHSKSSEIYLFPPARTPDSAAVDRLWKRPNQSSEPTPTSGTSAAEQPLVPAAVVAHL